MSVVPLPVAAVASPADRAIRLSNAVAAAYLAATTSAMLTYARMTGNDAPLVAHLVALGAALTVVAVRRAELQRLRDWLPLLLGPFLYVELRWLIPAVGRPHSDAIVLHWEHVLFGGNPSATWALAMPSLVLSESLHFAYASYYALVLVPPIVLYARGKRDGFAATLLALTIVYAACFSTYLLFPVDGPRYLVGPAHAPDGPVRAFVLHLLESGSSRGTAFPSSHVAASVVSALCALTFQRRLGKVVAVLTVGLTLGTVYGGFHYGVDALAGAVLGALCWLGARAAWRALSLGAQRATAA